MMNSSKQRTLSMIHTFMIYLNLTIVLFCATVILLSTSALIHQQQALNFLEDISVLPMNPWRVFYGAIILYGILAWIMYYRQNDLIQTQKRSIIYAFLEVIVCCILMYLLYMGYHGLVLLIFCDCVYYFKNERSTWITLGLLILIYLLSSYEVFSSFHPLPSLSDYIGTFHAPWRGLLFLTKTVLETMNIMSFVGFMTYTITYQMRENENISQELSMILNVNQELRDYAAMTEKIGEDRERKRLAREIHDTLGHALTGIAAGVDACLAMIDIDPNKTKKQLQIVSRVVRQGIGDVRNALNKLRPGALEERGLHGALEKMIEEFTSVNKIQIELYDDLAHIDLDKTKEDMLFRIIQESITNATRHGHATNVKIDLTQSDHQLHLVIQDNGQGCEDIHFGFGLKQMEERVAIMNGFITFDGKNGFRTEVDLPLERGETE